MAIHKFRWSKVYESPEEELIAFLQSRGITGRRVVIDGPGEPLQHQAAYETTLWCAEGSLVVRTKSARITLQPGDALRLAATTAYEIQAGISGCSYYETSVGGLSN